MRQDIVPCAGLAMLELNEDQIAEMLERALSLSAIDQLSIQKFRRLYSTVWTVSGLQNGTRFDYVIKDAGSQGEKQSKLSARADKIFLDDPEYFSPAVVYEPVHHVLIARKYEGPSLQSVMAGSTLSNPIGWYNQVSGFLCRAGSWLRRYHSADRHGGSISAALMCYIDRRNLGQLPSDMRQELLRLVEGTPVDDMTIVHGDFSPENILSNGRTICVVDFGISEWTEMSGWWDVATLLVGLDRYFLFRKSGLPYWFRPLVTNLKAAFLKSYSGSTLSTAANRSLLVCTAVRHFTFAVGKSANSGADGRGRWHLAQLERLLSSA